VLQKEDLEYTNIKQPFDPRFGFTIKNVKAKKEWITYKCSINKNDITHDVKYYLQMHCKYDRVAILFEILII